LTKITTYNNITPTFEHNKFTRNGLSPVDELQNSLAERIGHAASTARSKLVYRSPGWIYSAGASYIAASSASERTRWRFAFHSGPYAHYLFVRLWMAEQSNSTSADCYTRLRIVDSAGALFGDAIRHYGSSGVATSSMPSTFGLTSSLAVTDASGALAELVPNTAYFGTFSDFNSARLVAACVWEVALVPDTDDGYPGPYAASGSPIFDLDRSAVVAMANAQWAYGAQPLFHWSSETDAGAPAQVSDTLSGSLAQSIGSISLYAEGTSPTVPPAFQAASSVETGVGVDVEVDWPTHAANDVALFSVAVFSQGAAATLATPTGWTHIANRTQPGDDDGHITNYMFWRRASSSAMGSVTATFPATYAVSMSAVITTYRGCITTSSPVDDSITYIGGPGTTHGGWVLLTNFANQLHVTAIACVVSGGFSAWTNADLTITERVDSDPIGIGTGPTSATGVYALTSATTATSTHSASISVALRP
jgi:hypothetical protein